MGEHSSFWNSNEPDGNPCDTGEALPCAFSDSSVKKRFSILGFGLALYTVVSLGVALVIQLVALFIDPNLLENSVFLNVVSPIALYGFALPVLLGVLYLFKVNGEAPEKKKLSIWALLLIFVVGYGLMYIGSFAGQGVMWGISSIVGYDYSNALESMIDYKYMWVTFICMCVVAPIGEELVFRKLIIDRTHKYGGFVSIFFSGLIFGLMHGNFYQFFYAFALGLVLGYLYYSTGNIWYCVGIHAGINFMGSVVTSYLDLGVTEMTEAFTTLDATDMEAATAFASEYWLVILAFFAFFAFMALAMISAVVLPIVFRKKIAIEKEDLPLERKKAMSLAFLNVGAIVMLAVYLLEFALNLIPTSVG